MKFSNERYRHWPVDWYADMSQFTCNNWNRRNLLVALNLMSKASASTYTTEECHGSFVSTIPKQLWLLLFYLWPENIWQQLPSNISTLYYFNTVLHQRTLQGRGTTDESEVLLPLLSNAACFVRWRIESSQWCIFTPFNRQTNPHITTHYNICYQDCVHSLLFLSLQQWGISFNTEDFSSLTMTPALPSLAVFFSQQ